MMASYAEPSQWALNGEAKTPADPPLLARVRCEPAGSRRSGDYQSLRKFVPEPPQ